MRKLTIILVVLVIVLSGCTAPVIETTVSETETLVEPSATNTREPTPTQTLEPTFTFTPTLEPTETPTSTPTPKPVDLYNRLNWEEFYHAVPEEWGWKWVEHSCSESFIVSKVSDNPTLCVAGPERKSYLDTQKYLIPFQILDISSYKFVEYIPYLYFGPLDESINYVDFAMSGRKHLTKIFNEIEEYSTQIYGQNHSVQILFYTELTEEEWSYLITKIPSWDVSIKGPVIEGE